MMKKKSIEAVGGTQMNEKGERGNEDIGNRIEA